MCCIKVVFVYLVRSISNAEIENWRNIREIRLDQQFKRQQRPTKKKQCVPIILTIDGVAC